MIPRLACRVRDRDDRGGSPAAGGVRAPPRRQHAAPDAHDRRIRPLRVRLAAPQLLLPTPRPAVRQQQDAVLGHQRAAAEARRGGALSGPAAPPSRDDRVQPVRDGALRDALGVARLPLGPDAVRGRGGTPRPRALRVRPEHPGAWRTGHLRSLRDGDDRASGVGLLAVPQPRGAGGLAGGDGERAVLRAGPAGEVHGGVPGADPDPDRAGRGAGVGALARRGDGAGWPGGWAGRGRTRRSTSRPSWWS